MSDVLTNIHNLYRLLDCLNILFSPDNPFRVSLACKIYDMLDDLEKDVTRKNGYAAGDVNNNDDIPFN